MLQLNIDREKVDRQTRVRLVIWVFNSTLLGVGSWSGYYSYGLEVVALLSTSFLIVSLVPLFLVPRWPALHAWVFGGLVVDLGFNTFAMMLTGGVRSPFFLMELWIVVAYITRYGRGMVVPATTVGVASLAITGWHQGLDHLPPEVSMQLLVLIALPAYVSVLLAELTQAQNDADRANRAKSRFLARMSHEIRTPLAALVGTTELLKRTSLSGEQKLYAQNLKTSANALRSLVDDILDFSKIEAGLMTLDWRAMKPASVIDEVMGVMTALANERGITLRNEITDDVPKTVLGDPDRLRQVLFNLVGNAVKFTEDGEVVIRSCLTTNARSDAAMLRMEVSDTGLGIPKDQLESIFDSFRQAHASHTSGGTGLGTTISRELVRLMDGHIGVKSTLGVGSTFWFEIPLRTAADATDSSSAGADASTTGPDDRDTEPSHPALPVLLAEDDAINANVVSTLLGIAGYQVDVVSNGEQALQALHDRAYGVAFIDRRMPIMNGVEVARRWRADETANHRVPLVTLTADATIEDERESREAGFDEFLVKPVSADRLIAVAAEQMRAGQRPAATN